MRFVFGWNFCGLSSVFLHFSLSVCLSEFLCFITLNKMDLIKWFSTNHGLMLWFPFQFHDVGTSLRLNDDSKLKLSSVGLVFDACLWLDTPWLNSSLLVLAICES